MALNDNLLDGVDELRNEIVKEGQSLSNESTAKPIDIKEPTVDTSFIDEMFSELGAKVNQNDNQVEVNQDIDYEQQGEAIIDNVFDSISNDPLRSSKINAYDADYTGYNFDRYYAVPRLYDKLGFSPYRDNESAYKNEITWAEDFSRSWDSMNKLADISFTSMFGYMPFVSDISDMEEAKEVARINTVGRSSLDGGKGFFNDLVLNHGYTVGIIGSFIAEEIALWGITAATGGIAGIGAAGKAAASGARAIDKLKDAWSAKNYYTGLTKTGRIFDNLKDVKSAREFFTWSKGGRTVTDFLVPQTAANIRDIVKAGKAGEQMSNYAKVLKTFGGFYRKVKQVGAALAESKMEAGGVELDTYNRLLDEHRKNNNGKNPTEDEVSKMLDIAQKAGENTFALNVPVLYLTNKIVLGTMFKGASWLKNTSINLGDGLKIVQKAGKKGFKEGFEVVNKSIKQSAKGLINPKNYKPLNMLRNSAMFIGNYTKANFAEGLQEIYQESVSAAMQDYYKEIYDSQGVTGSYLSSVKKLPKAIYDMAKSEYGAEVFASGFLMGGLIQGPQHLAFKTIPKLAWKALGDKFKYVGAKESYKEYKKKKDEYANELANALTEATANISDYFDANIENMSLQSLMTKFNQKKNAKDENLKDYKDNEHDALFNHIDTIIKSGQVDIFIDSLSSMKDLSEQEIIEAFGEIEPSKGSAKEYYTRKIDEFAKKAKQVERNYKELDYTYPNPINKRENKKDWLLFEEGRKLMAYSNSSFRDILNRKTKIQEKINDVFKDMSNKNTNDINLLFDERILNAEIDVLKDEIEVYENGSPEQKSIAKRKKEKLSRLENYKNSVSEFNVLIEQQRQGQEVESNLSDNSLEMRKNLLKYLSHLDNNMSKKAADEAFKDIYDYLQLDVEGKILGVTIDLLNNPLYVKEYIDRLDNARSKQHQNRKKGFESAIKKTMDNALTQELLQKLLEKGYYFKEDELDDFVNKNKFPDKLYDVETGEVKAISEDVMLILYQYEQANKEFTNKTLSSFLKFTEATRDNKDKRLLKDIMDSLGVKLDEDGVGSIKIKDVLQFIIDSQYSNIRQKILAQNIISELNENDEIVLDVSLNAPYTYSFDEGLKINPYHASYGFKNTVGIEQLLLKGLMHSLSVEALKDEKFDEQINELREKTIDGVFKGKEVKPYLGLTSNEEFVNEVLTNDEFRKVLNGIKYDSKGDSIWKKFLKAISDYLGKLFKGEDTLLIESLRVITTKIGTEEESFQDKLSNINTTILSFSIKRLNKVVNDINYDDIEGLLEGKIIKNETLFNELNKRLENALKNNPANSIPVFISVINDFIKELQTELDNRKAKREEVVKEDVITEEYKNAIKELNIKELPSFNQQQTNRLINEINNAENEEQLNYIQDQIDLSNYNTPELTDAIAKKRIELQEQQPASTSIEVQEEDDTEVIDINKPKEEFSIKEKYRGKIIYVTHEAGKTFIKDNLDNVYDTDVLYEKYISQAEGQTPRKEGQTIQNYIYEFKFSKTSRAIKEDVDKQVLAEAKQILKDNPNAIVLTGTIRFTKYEDTYLFDALLDIPKISYLTNSQRAFLIENGYSYQDIMNMSMQEAMEVISRIQEVIEKDELLREEIEKTRAEYIERINNVTLEELNQINEDIVEVQNLDLSLFIELYKLVTEQLEYLTNKPSKSMVEEAINNGDVVTLRDGTTVDNLDRIDEEGFLDQIQSIGSKVFDSDIEFSKEDINNSNEYVDKSKEINPTLGGDISIEDALDDIDIC